MGIRPGAIIVALCALVMLLVTAPAATASGAAAVSGARAVSGALSGPTSVPASGPASVGRDDGERLLFRFQDPAITESSGLALSPAHEGVIYTHNDSSAGPIFFAVGPKGKTRATFRLSGAAARDWEGMAVSTDPATGRGVLWFADIGDNFDGGWPDVSVYRVDEPATLRDATLPATRYRFRYEDGGRNAEGVMVHPRTGRLYIVSKEFAGGVYAAPRKLRTDRVNVLRRVGSAPIMATDAAYAPDGSGFVIRTYFSATIYSEPGKSVGRVTMPSLDQAESIAYTRDGKALLTGSEGAKSPVYQVPIPTGVLAKLAPATAKAAAPATSPPASPQARERSAGASEVSAAGPSGSGVPVRMIFLWLAVAVCATVIVALIARTAR
ncbi:hypothetical protein HNP84_009286 [Thermocatellispora tengchongensis]|uniref:Esterase-like activity of phytase family protein n=1 Tax=Thermocatellispora tengchongensis TaxID=1073253 RepID=A0A840PNB7_9ACTN|nr:hypothetical protein [Thermocatellispora tengchongensis]MBB5139523.1 hypothetical protein [Thermocatellispora tengchongensis]